MPIPFLIIPSLLILIPSAASFDCRGACALCAMDTSPETAACTLCRECKKTDNRRSRPNNQEFGDQLQKIVSELDGMDFGQVMRQKSLLRADRSTSKGPDDCIGESFCISPLAEDFSGKLLREEKKILKKQCPPGTDKNCSPTIPRHCPPIKPCMKTSNGITSGEAGSTSSDIPSYAQLRDSILGNIVASSLENTAQEQTPDCPTQPKCSDEEDFKRPMKLKTKKVTILIPCHPKKSSACRVTPSCVPCTPSCTLPCGVPYPQIYQPTFLPASTPKGTVDPLTEIKPKVPKKLSKEESTSVGENDELMQSKEKNYKKEYHHFYVGIPKDVKTLL